MLIVRYFLLAGCFVVALLFALASYLPPIDERSEATDLDRSTIRIHSARNLPEKIVFDTSNRIAATVSAPALAAGSPERTPSNALAMIETRKPQTKIAPAPRPATSRAAGHRSNRMARSASPRRLYDRQLMVGAF